MKILIGSSFWILPLAVILNSIELSSQSGTPGKKGDGTSGPRTPSPHGLRPEPLPFRKVRCPTDEERTVESLFQMKDANGTYGECTHDTILLAIGPMIIGFISGDKIGPIYGIRGNEIMYDEETEKQIKVESKFLKENFGVFGPVPEETLRSSVIHPFGMFSPERPRNLTIPWRRKRPRNPDISRTDFNTGPG